MLVENTACANSIGAGFAKVFNFLVNVPCATGEHTKAIYAKTVLCLIILILKLLHYLKQLLVLNKLV